MAFKLYSFGNISDVFQNSHTEVKYTFVNFACRIHIVNIENRKSRSNFTYRSIHDLIEPRARSIYFLHYENNCCNKVFVFII